MPVLLNTLWVLHLLLLPSESPWLDDVYTCKGVQPHK